MERFCIVTNKSKDINLEVTGHIVDYLQKHGKSCVIADTAIGLSKESNAIGREFMTNIPEDTDCCIVLGGDGTMLQAARSVAFQDIPLLGVNLGTLGYLAVVEKSGIDDAMTRLLSGDYYIEDRMMLRGVIGDKKDYALNDIVISRASEIQAINYNIYVNDLLLYSYHADGIIVATPTGSTGYNMSAGGPIVEPSANMILLTPICPHTLNSRSVVLSADARIVVELLPGRDNRMPTVAAAYDGSGVLELKAGDRMEIHRSKKTTKIIKFNRVSFLEILGKKFSM
ncbi:MAG: NAD(+)/NADH kinase [Butyrivibrio sp.]|nr:NAD(+)/NADH kinase [Butyrivibrio sp.]